MADAPASVRMLAADRGFTRLQPAGGGVEFQVYAATAPDGSQVVLRIPAGGRFQFSPNDGQVDTRALLRWEYAVTWHLDALGFPVAAPRELVLGDPDVLVSDFVTDDGLDYEAVLAGYAEQVPVDSAAFWVYRLDTAVMLALLFTSEVPQDGRGPRAIDRLREVHQRLSRELDK
jgi:hypothetical protein